MPTNSKKNTLIIVAILIVLAIAVLAWLQQRGPRESPPAYVGEPSTTSTLPAGVSAEDKPQAINDSLQNIDMGNLEQEFQTIDQDMNAL